MKRPDLSENPQQVLDPDRWLESHGDALFSFAFLQLKDRRSVEDLVQETLMAGLEARSQFAGKSSERTWLIGILKHKIADHFRQSRGEELLSDVEQQDAVWENCFTQRGLWKITLTRWRDSPDQVLQDREFWRILEACLGRLPTRMARAFCLRELDGLSSDQVCQVLRISATNLWTLTHRARGRLRQCLEKNWFGK